MYRKVTIKLQSVLLHFYVQVEQKLIGDLGTSVHSLYGHQENLITHDILQWLEKIQSNELCLCGTCGKMSSWYQVSWNAL